MEIEPGLRVVRGPDWKWDDQDGGEGCLGTVAEAPAAAGGDRTAQDGVVVVQWDAGNRCNYRCGMDGKYDLRVYDSAPTGNFHRHVMCDSCRKKNVPGIRWKCTRCYDFDLCTPCYYSGKHKVDHKFWRIDSEKNNRKGVVLPTRESSQKICAKGFFANAMVVRGHDWLWGDQDGGLGSSGIIKALKDHSDTTRSIVEVEWSDSRKMNIYRAGHKGKVDIRCLTVGEGASFYPDHLPILGASAPVEVIQERVPTAASTDNLTPKFKVGDRVKVQLEVEIFRQMQEGHGGWNDQMAEVLSEVGTVHTVLDSGDLRVRYPSTLVWTMNPDTVSVVGAEQFSVGDVIRVIDDIAKVHDLQENHGGWVDDMALSLGQAGRVTKVFPTGDIRASVNGRTWTFNPACLTPAPGENPPAVPDSPGQDVDLDDIRTQVRLLSLMGSPATVVAAAAARDADTVREYLTKNPQDVNTKASGKAALHCASVAGDLAVVKAILEFNPNLEIEDEDGDTPLHICAYCDEDEVAKLLLGRGAKINILNGKGATPLIIAAVKGHYSVLRILANHPDIRIHEQDTDGDTALHCAVLAQKNESVAILLGAGADPTRVNFRLFTPIHEAARVGFLPAVEQFARAKCDLNLKKDDGFAPIHLAALNDHLDVVTALAEMNSCDINGVTHMDQTALHIAVHQGHARIVERLVGFGVKLDVQDATGDTALHIALSKTSIDVLSAETPQLKKVRESFDRPGDVGPHATATVACFLIQEGASIVIPNKKGQIPLQTCTPDVVSLVMSFKDSLALQKPQKFHGSLRSLDVTSPTSPDPITLFAVGGGGKSDGLAVGAASPASPPPAAVTRTQQSVETQQSTDSDIAAAPAGSGQEACFLCESPVDVKFEPCGHAMMCSTCGQRAKRCPQCKAIVKTLSKLKVTCPMCNEEEVSVTMRPCGHEFCPGCARRMRICFDCRNVIISKEGLPAETRSDAPPASGIQKCAICLTEPRNTALLCGHQLCWDCAQRVDHCPVCRKFITHRIQLF